MKKNLFENAKPGDIFITQDGREAIFLCQTHDLYGRRKAQMFLQHDNTKFVSGVYWVFLDGTIDDGFDNDANIIKSK